MTTLDTPSTLIENNLQPALLDRVNSQGVQLSHPEVVAAWEGMDYRPWDAWDKAKDEISVELSLRSEFVRRTKIVDTLSTFAHEMVQEDNRFNKIAGFTIGALTQVADRSRVLAILLPRAFDEALEFSFKHGYDGYRTAGIASGAAAVTYGLYGTAVGKSFHMATRQFPVTAETVRTNHPNMVAAIESAVGGFPKEEILADAPQNEGGIEVGPYASRKTLLGKIALAAQRGLASGFLYGNTAYVGVAELHDYSDKSIFKLRRAATVEAMGAIGIIAAGISAAVTNNMFGIAEDIKNVISNKTILLSTSGFLIYASALLNSSARHKAAESLEAGPTENEMIDEEALSEISNLAMAECSSPGFGEPTNGSIIKSIHR